MLLVLQLNNLLGQVPPVLLGTIPNISASLNSGTHQYDLSQYVAGATSYAISPAVEAGWSFHTGTGLLTIDTDAAATFGPYTVTFTNANGDTPGNAFTVRVSAFTSAAILAGTAYSDTGVMGTNYLSDVTPVPAGAFFVNGFAHDQDGLRYVCPWPSSDISYPHGGIARRSDGAMVIATSGTITTRLGGIAVTYRGEVLAAVAVPDLIHNGQGLKSDGTLCVSATS